MHPILFHLPLPHFGDVPFYSYGVMLGISLLMGWWVSLYLAQKDGLPREAMANCYVDTAVTALIGSRILYVITNLDEFQSFGSLFQFRNGGLVAYGGFLGAVLGSWLSLRFGFGISGLFRKVGTIGKAGGEAWIPLPVMAWADCAIPPLGLGICITRIGCYLFGCDFGQPLTEKAPEWLKKLGTFPHWAAMGTDAGEGSPAWALHVKEHLISPDATTSLPVHPTQLYESFLGLCLFVFLMTMRKYRRFRGEVFMWCAFIYGVARFSLEVVRDDAERGSVPPAEPPHILFPFCFVVFALAFSLLMAPRIQNKIARTLLQAASFAPAVLAYLHYRPGEYANIAPEQLSTSQLVGLLSGCTAAVVFAILYKAALLHPEAAMAIPDFSNYGKTPDDDDEEEDEEEVERKRRAEAKKKAKQRIAAALAEEEAETKKGDDADQEEESRDEEKSEEPEAKEPPAAEPEEDENPEPPPPPKPKKKKKRPVRE